MAIDWNTVGLHVVTTLHPGSSSSRVYYDDHPVPEGKYTLLWPASIHSLNGDKRDRIDEIIEFIITKK